MDGISQIKRRWFNNELEILKKNGISRAEIARRLDILPQTLNNILNGNRGLSDGFLDKFIVTFQISRVDLLPDEKYPVASTVSTIAHPNHEKAIPLIPSNAIAGYGSFDFQELPVENYYTVEELKDADFLIRVQGDSMYPKFNNGDIVACRKIDAITFWQWHKIYAICTRNQGILIKRVEEYRNNPAFITCRSENPAYSPFELHEDEIISAALVLGAIILE